MNVSSSIEEYLARFLEGFVGGKQRMWENGCSFCALRFSGLRDCR